MLGTPSPMQQATRIVAGRYELGPMLGQGGMARVHRGFDRVLGRPVAVKVLLPPYDRDEAFVARFRREARDVARLSHPNVVAVFDTGTEGRIDFIVTELVEGETLAEAIRRDAPFGPDRAARIACEICRGLQAAHDLGIVHRDVKPGNVMLAEGGVKVVDFGVARAAEGESLTRTGLMLGSAPYLAPERAEGAPGDERSDLYSLGCVLFEMLTGRPPFVGAAPVALLYQHVNGSPPALGEMAAVPPELERVVHRLLEKDPARRFASAAEAEAALEASILGAETVPLPTAGGGAGPATAPMPQIEAPRREDAGRRTWWTTGVVALWVLVIAAIVVGWSSRDSSRAPSPEGAATLPTVEQTYGALVEAISTARSDDRIDREVAEQLERRAAAILDAFAAADPLGVSTAAERFADALASEAEDGSVTFEAAGTIADPFERLLAALELSPSPSPTSDPTSVDATDGGGEPATSGDRGGSKGNGPPPHANGDPPGHDDD